MLIETLCTLLRKARSVNETSNAFVSKVPMATEPVDDAATATGQATINMLNGGNVSQNGLMILPYGLGADNTTFSVRVLGWRRAGNNSATLLWVPILLVEFDCIVDATSIGLAGRQLGATEAFVDTITLVTNAGNANVSHEIVSPANDVNVAHVMVDSKGCDRVELQFKVGTATSANALVAFV